MSEIPSSNMILEFYEDKELTKRVFAIQSDIPINVGTTRTWTLFVKNAIRDELRNISFYSDDKDISFSPNIINYLLPNEFLQVNVTWSPPIDRRTALKCVLFAYVQVIIKP
jgi:hypothetical protein